MNKRIKKKILNRALEKRRVIHCNKSKFFVYTRYYKRNPNPKLTFKELKQLKEFDEYCDKITTEILDDIYS